MEVKSPSRRRWLRFSLRTLFVLVTMFCIYLAWAMNWIKQRREFLLANTGPNSQVRMSILITDTPSPWRLRLLQEPGVTSISCLEFPNNSEANQWIAISKLFPETKVYPSSLDLPMYGSSFPPPGYFESYWQNGEWISFYDLTTHNSATQD